MKKISQLFVIAILILSCRLLFAADTAKLAYSQYTDGFWQIWVVDAGGKAAQQLTFTPADKLHPSASAAQKKIAYTTNDGKLWVMDMDGKNSRQIPLPVPASGPCWAASGKNIIFTSYRNVYLELSDIWMVNPDGKNLKKVLRRPWQQFGAKLSPDEKSVIFIDAPELTGHEIAKFDLKSKDVIQLTQNRDYEMQASFSPDGERIVYASDKDGSYNIWIMDKFGRNPQNLTKSPEYDICPVFSPDGSRIFFLSDRSGSMEIYSMDTAGKGIKQVTKDKNDKQDICIH